ncbi:alpha-xenorhabdolysin family binary toxin subunit A [Pseudomonas viridiflava]|uniref:alpha-xenorhabdolysin family binary toxin subunit A n=1 Tax=Pseudomonas viridiflava TaxID=33069 RepID=UPI001F078930|nr:alpha-xenorhabdolysin family binary toxin subunit A [Pseudomonas viridiflava]
MSIYENLPVSTDTVVDEAARAPILLFDYSAANHNDSAREPGLFLTKEQLKNIKRYEIAGLALPVELNNVIHYLGYATGAGKGLEAVDFQKTFTLIHNHASSWNPLRVDLISVGQKLEVFAGEMQSHGRSMEEVVTDIRALDRLDEYNIKTLEDVRKLEVSMGHKFPGIALDDWDKEAVSDFGYILDKILDSVKQQEAEANSIKVRLDTFAIILAEQVRPALQLKLRLIDNSTLSDDIKALNVIINRRATHIDDKVKEYKDLVKQAIGSAGSFNIVGLAMSIYTGVDAERVRKERDRLRAEQARDIAEMQTKNRILGSLNKVRLDLQDLDLIVIDADIATKNLVTVWNRLSIFIKQSSDRVDEIDDALSVRRFIGAFRLVVDPWDAIKKDAGLLLAVFAEADKEFRAEYQSQPNRLGSGA